ncbi:putative MRG-domain-containing protein [Seiridium cardinale]|uniref:MRG-domain-containing protein n=1 Tax=Seiridium cardinale TaxID=138064 RepID=A0ABR2X842_9PEZI
MQDQEELISTPSTHLDDIEERSSPNVSKDSAFKKNRIRQALQPHTIAIDSSTVEKATGSLVSKRRTRSSGNSVSIKEEIGFEAALKEAIEQSLHGAPPLEYNELTAAAVHRKEAKVLDETASTISPTDKLIAPCGTATKRKVTSSTQESAPKPNSLNSKKHQHTVDHQFPSLHKRIRSTMQSQQDFATAFKLKEARYAKASARSDHLSRLPPTTKHIYVNRKGELLSSPNDTPYHSFTEDKPLHPKLKEAEKNGTSTREKYKWYKDMPRDVNIPVAGIPLDKPHRPKRNALIKHSTIDFSSLGIPTVLGRDLWRPLARAPTLTFGPLPFILQMTNCADFQQEDAFHQRPSIKIQLPDLLKGLLVDDWENITKNNQLVPLPHPKPVTLVLDNYLEYEKAQRQEGSSSIDILEETIAGLKEYFDKCLGRILLYRFERPQYAEIREKWTAEGSELFGKTPCDTYGCEHLMRLFTALPELVAQTNMDQQSVNRLREELSKFCQWLERNAGDYFLSEYEVPNTEYSEKAKN